MKTKSFLALAIALTVSLASFAGVQQTVDDLIPKLAADKIEDRYAAQMSLQSLAADASSPGARSKRSALAKILAAKAGDPAVPQPARVWVVRQLEYIGASESVPALTSLLSGHDAELRECARRALEKNSSSAATKSLRSALEQGGDSAWTTGLIQSLGERGDASSVGLIAPYLDTPQSAFVAGSALAKIGSSAAIKALWEANEKNNAIAAPSLIVAADRFANKGHQGAAAKIYQQLYASHSNSSLRAAALAGLARTKPASAKNLIPELLAGNEKLLQFAAVDAARVVYDKKVTAALVPLLPTLNNHAKVFVIRVLDGSAEIQLMAATADSDESVRCAAIERLGQVGSLQSASILITAASGPASKTKDTAAAALARISSRGIDQYLMDVADQGVSSSRVEAIKALTLRNDQAALPQFLKFAAETNHAVSSAACAALSKMGTDKELEGLVRLCLSGDVSDAQDALKTVAGRAKNKSDAAKLLTERARTATPQQVGSIFDTFAVLGGEEAVATVSSYATGSNDELKSDAIRALGDFVDFAAAKPLTVIAADPNVKPAHSVLAIHGIVSLVKAAEHEPPQARLDAALGAMKAAQRKEDKILLLSAFAAIPSPKAADVIKDYLHDETCKVEAGLAGLTLAESLLKPDKDAAKKLAGSIKDANISADITKKAEDLIKK